MRNRSSYVHPSVELKIDEVSPRRLAAGIGEYSLERKKEARERMTPFAATIPSIPRQFPRWHLSSRDLAILLEDKGVPNCSAIASSRLSSCHVARSSPFILTHDRTPDPIRATHPPISNPLFYAPATSISRNRKPLTRFVSAPDVSRETTRRK